MPRIYYKASDQERQDALFLIHGVVYALGVALLWVTANGQAAIITLLWTALLAYHSHWRSAITESTQTRTYNRLRNRYGADWDLAASSDEFELERQIALLEIKQRHVLPDTVRVALALLAVLLLIVFLVPYQILMLRDVLIAASSGWLLTVVALYVRQSDQLRFRRAQLQSRIAKKRAAPASQTTSAAAKLMLRPGMTYALGDDGELVEVPQTQQIQKSYPAESHLSP